MASTGVDWRLKGRGYVCGAVNQEARWLLYVGMAHMLFGKIFQSLFHDCHGALSKVRDVKMVVGMGR